MPDPALRVEGLWKEYRLGDRSLRSETLYDALARRLRAPFGRPSTAPREAGSDRFWALRDIGFELEPGEVLGIIGRNGAGKSTLLKILSRITEPSRGRIEVRGRVASLLEVGTGFHPELTGRENIFLNGAILGMARREILRKFDEIVAFAGIERFLGTPVKRYSSGMYVRLAFSVAAHLEPDVLVVDEVLAVGDAEFQRKCTDKMRQVGGRGRTVLFVSHNMAAVAALCDRALELRQGTVAHCGDTRSVIAAYQRDTRDQPSAVWIRQLGEGPRNLLAADASDAVTGAPGSASFDAGVAIDIRYRVPEAGTTYAVVVKLTNSAGVDILSSTDLDSLAEHCQIPGTEVSTRCLVPPSLLRPDHYQLQVMLVAGPSYSVSGRETIEQGLEVSSVGFPFEATRWGVVAPTLSWLSTPQRSRESS